MEPDQTEFHGYVEDLRFGHTTQLGVDFREIHLTVRFHDGMILSGVLMCEIDHPGWNPNTPKHLKCHEPLRAVILSKLRFESALHALPSPRIEGGP